MRCRACCYGPRAAVAAAIAGSLLCVAFALIFYFFQPIFDSIVADILVVRPGGFVYGLWADIPFDFFIEIYFFNYVNGDEFTKNKTVKPKVEQIGPYTYSLTLKKVFIDFNEPPLVNYRQIHTFHFHPELSVGSEDDVFTMPNVIPMVLNALEDDPKVAKLFDMLSILDAEPPFINVSVGDILIYGYQDKALEKVQNLLGFELIPEGRVGLIYGRNGSDDKKYKMDTGSYDRSQMFQIKEWNGHANMDYIWNDSYCGMINGSDGTMFHDKGKFDMLYMFISFIKRSIYFNYTNEEMFKGLKLNHYEIPIEFFGDYNMNPDNLCFTDRDPDKTFASGLWFMGKILHGAPIYASNPHFMGGDFKLVDSIDGMHPRGKQHIAQVGIFPEVGVPLHVKLRIQLNMLMKPGFGMKSTADYPTVMLPLLWANVTFELPDDYAADVRKYYYGGLKLIYSIILILIIVFGLVALLGIFCSYKLMFQLQSEIIGNKEEKTFEMEEREKSITTTDEKLEDNY